jgi:methyltransferase
MVISSSAIAYLALVLVIGSQRVFELQLSRRNARAALARGGVESGQAHYPWMVLLHAAFLASCASEVVGLRRPFPGDVGLAALGGLLAAQGLRYWAIASLGPRWSTRVIALPGAPLVATGPYRFFRHPNYVAVAAELALLPIVHGAWLTATVFSLANAVLLAVRIRVEERALGISNARS